MVAPNNPSYCNLEFISAKYLNIDQSAFTIHFFGEHIIWSQILNLSKLPLCGSWVSKAWVPIW